VDHHLWEGPAPVSTTDIAATAAAAASAFAAATIAVPTASIPTVTCTTSVTVAAATPAQRGHPGSNRRGVPGVSARIPNKMETPGVVLVLVLLLLLLLPLVPALVRVPSLQGV
jgi:hypothetical protein